MRAKIPFPVLILLFFASFNVNFGPFMVGCTPSPLGTALSILYIVFWFVFPALLRKNRKVLRAAAVWQLMTFLAASAALVLNLLDHTSSSVLVIALALLTIPPLYGMRAFFPRPGYVPDSIAVMALSLVLALLCALFLLRLRRNGKRED